MPKYDPYSRSLHEDPYPTYTELRGRCPVYHDEQKDFWALFRFADVQSGVSRLAELHVHGARSSSRSSR